MPDQTNPYDSLVQQDTAQNLRVSMMNAVDKQPDTEAKLQALARDYQMPVEAVRLCQPEIERKARLDALNYDQLAQLYPKAANALSDPQRAAIGHDDVDNMTTLERIGGGLKATAKYIFSAPDTKNTLAGDIGAGVFMASRGAAGVFQATAEFAAPPLDFLESRPATGGNPLRRLAEGFAALGADAGAQAKALSPASPDLIQGGVSSGIQSLTQNLALLPMAFANPAATLYTMAGLQGGQSYQDAREKGVGQNTALAFGASQAVIEFATEKLPLAKLLGDVKAGTPLFKSLMQSAALEVPGEQVATVLQDLNEWAVLNPDKPFTKYLEERPSAAAQTLIATLVGTGGNVTLAHAAQRVMDTATGEQRSAQQAEAHAKVLEEFTKLAEASKVRERDPAAFASFAQSLVEDSVPNIYVDAKALLQAADINELAAALPSVAEQIQQAAATGQDVVIPTQELLTAGPGQSFMQTLIDNARTAPEAMSPVEARTYMQSQGDQLQADIAQVLEAKQGDTQWQQMRDQLRDEFKTQLDGVKRFTSDVNQQYATLLANFYSVTAAKLGVTPQELATKYGLQTRGDGVQGGVALDQGAVQSIAEYLTQHPVKPPSGMSPAEFKTFAKGRREGLAQLVDRLKPSAQGLVVPVSGGGYWMVTQEVRPDGGEWRVTRFGGDMEPHGHEAHATVEDALNDVILRADVSRLGETLNQSAPDLIVTHNLTAANLLHADKMGGLPVPSLAVTKKDTPLTGFGDITLIGPPEMADPKGYASTKVFGADIYSPRYPSVERELDSKAWADFRKKFEPMAQETGTALPDRDDVERRGVEQLDMSIAVMGQFLRDKGVEPKIVMRPSSLSDARRARLEQFGLAPWLERTDAFAMMDNAEFVRLAAEEATAAYRETGDERMAARADKMVNDPVTAKNLARDLAYRIAADAKQRAKPEADKYETQKSLKDQIEAAELSATFSSYVGELLDGMTKSERIPQGYSNNGRRKYIPHTLDNVVKILKKDLRGGESFNYGMGSVRAKFTPQFKSIAQIKKEKSRLVSAEQFDAIKGEINKEFLALSNALKVETETLASIMEDGAKQGLVRAAKTYSVDLGEAHAEQIAEFMDKLRNLPTAYFEAKILRDVSLSEFKGAVVPEGADAKVLDALRKAGVTDVRTYKAGDEAARAAAIQEFSGLFFQEARGSINLPEDLTRSPAIISLFKGADLSTFIHESGHFFLEVQMDLAARIQAQVAEGGALTEGEQSIVNDANTLLAWMGVKGSETTSALTEWHSLDIEAKRPMHEQFARGFEAYAFEGNAPSTELAGMFSKFRAWMLAVYKELKALRVELTDDVRGVMDRMLASTQAIQEAEAARRLGPLFKTAEQAGMTLDEFKAYHALATDASQAAIEELQARGLRDLKWLQGAKDRKLKEMQKLHDSLRREVRAEVRREVMSQPVYRAWQFLTGKGDSTNTAQAEDKPKAGKELDPVNDSLFVAVAKMGGLRKEDAVKVWGIDPKEKLESGVFGAPVLRATGGMDIDTLGERLLEAGYLTPDENGKHDPQELEEKFDAERRGDPIYSLWHSYSNPDAPAAPLAENVAFGKLDAAELTARYGATGWQRLADLKMTSKSRGISSDVVAEVNGFDSGDQMVKALLDAQAPKDVIEGMTDQRMLERFGDLGTPEGLQRAVDRAIHNEVRARFVASEIKALEKGSKVKAPGLSGRTTVDLLAQAAKTQAERIIGGTKVRNLKPSQYTNAETRAAKAAERAMLEGKTDEALAEKRHQLINLQAAKAATMARDEVEKIGAYLRKFADKPKTLDADYYDQIAQLLERFDFKANTSLRALDKRKSLAAWVDAQREQGLEPDIPAELLDAAHRVSFKDMTVDELRGLRDTVRQIERLGRLKNELLTAKELRDFQAVRDAVADSVYANANGRTADTRTPSTRSGKWFKTVKDFGAAHIKAATWARIFDGGRDGGPVWEYFVRPANEAADMETRMRAEATEKLHAILTPVLKAGRMDGKGQHFPSIDRSMNREQVFAMALNMGNEGNLQRMLDGEGWTVQQIQPVLATLSASDWQAVQAVWDHFESYRPLIGAKERRIYGKEPEWVQPMPLLVKSSDGQDVQLRGGYYPVKYDPLANNRAEQHADAEDAKRQMQAAYTSATTRRGFTKSRAEAVKGRPLLYSLAGVYSGVNDVIHDLAFHEWLIDVNKLLRSDKINDAIRETYGPAAVKQLKTWIEDTARGEQGLQAELDSALGRLRQGVSMAGLGFNVMSAALQPLGLTQSIVRVGGKWIGKGVTQYIGSPLAKTREVNAKSDFMASRSRTRFRELNELRNQVEGESPVRTAVSTGAFFLMMRMQQTVDVPTWLGAYEKAISEGNGEDRAIALADQAVIDAQGGGQTKDLSAIERGGPAQKLFTVFYSFMNTALNLGVAQGMTEKSAAKKAADFLLLYSVPAVLGAMLKDALTPGDAGDWDSWEAALKKLMAEQLGFLFGLFVVGREFGEAAKSAMGLVEHSRDYSGPAGVRMISDTYGLAKQVSQGELDDAFRKQAVNIVGDLFGLPAAQVNRTITGANALAEGQTQNPAALVFGFQQP